MNYVNVLFLLTVGCSVSSIKADAQEVPAALSAQQEVKQDGPKIPPRVDFLTSMGWYYKENQGAVKKLFLAKPGPRLARLKALKELYNRNHFSLKKTEGKPVIPKIIHQIWVGPKQPPAIFKESQESIKKYHPDWEYRLWTDKDIPDLQLHNQKFYDLSKNYGEKADILRYELLHRYGGVYLDIDYICLKPLDVLLQYDVWASILPLKMEGGIANGIIGAVPGHPLLWDCIVTMKDDWAAFEKVTSSLGVLQRAGPRHFEKSFMKYVNDPSCSVIAFPTSYFYPVGFKKRLTALNKQNTGREQMFKGTIRPESFTVHCWAVSWWPRKK